MSLVMHVQGEKVLTVWLVFESNLFTDVNKPALVSDRDRCSAWGRVWTRYKGRPHDFDIGVCMQDLFFWGRLRACVAETFAEHAGRAAGALLTHRVPTMMCIACVHAER